MIDLKTLVLPEHIINPITGENNREIFELLTAPLVASGIVTDAKVFVADLEERENKVTTQIETNVAVPHARSKVVKRLGMTIGVAPEPGLNFDPDHETPCRLFFLMAIPSFAPTAHMPLLKKLAMFAHDHKRVEKLLESDNKKILKQLTSFRG